MRKKIFALIFPLMVGLCIASPALAADIDTFVLDDLSYLSSQEMAQLDKAARELSDRYDVDVIFAFLPSLDSDALEKFEHKGVRLGSGRGDAVIMAMTEERWATGAAGWVSDRMTQEDKEQIWIKMSSSETLYDMVTIYLDQVDLRLAQWQGEADAPVQDQTAEEAGLTQAEENGYLRLMDEADLLTREEEEKLLAELNEISRRQQVDVVVVTVYSLGGKSSMEYADDYFDYNGYGQGADRSGVLLLHSPEERDWWISTRGYGITAFTDAGIKYIGEQVTPYLAQGDNFEAYQTFARYCDDFLTRAKNGDPFEGGSHRDKSLSPVAIPVCIVIAAGISALVMKSLVAKLKIIHPRQDAMDYVQQGSMEIRENREWFLYRTVTRRARPKEHSGGGSSIHTSSSGATHGGGGGKY